MVPKIKHVTSFAHFSSRDLTQLHTLCSLKMKQEEVKSSAVAGGLTLDVSSDAAAQQVSCRRGRVVSFRFCFLFFIHNSCLLLFLHAAAAAVTAGACVVSCRFCLFRLYAAVLTLRLSPPRFQANAAAAGVVGCGKAVRQVFL